MDNIVCVLMATYNGEEYVFEMLNSIRNQTCQDFVCYIHDDGSTDSTCEIIDRFCEENCNFIRLESHPTGGAKNNFLYMLGKMGIQFQYCMFCDQDDIWLPDKIEKSLNKVRELENGDSSQPALAYCDMKIVDANLDEIAPSFIRYNALTIDNITIDRAIMKGYAAGCSMILNNALARVSAVENTKDIIMHDWWVILIASAVGKISYLDEALALYRQHGTNTLGAKHITVLSRISEIAGRVISGKQFEITRNGLYLRIRQLARCEDVEVVKKKYEELIAGAVTLKRMNKINRSKYIINNHLYQNKWSGLWTCICS